MAKCAICGKIIKNTYFLNGKIYGYECYKKELALIYKKFEDEKNAEYVAKCFAAMQVFKNKKSNAFHDSVCKQYDNYGKLTARQLECILKGFTSKEIVNFCIAWHPLTKKDSEKVHIASLLYKQVQDDVDSIIDNDDVIEVLLSHDEFKKYGLFFCYDKLCKKTFVEKIGRRGCRLKDCEEDDEFEVLKIVKKDEI